MFVDRRQFFSATGVVLLKIPDVFVNPARSLLFRLHEIVTRFDAKASVFVRCDSVGQCFSAFLLPRNPPQMFALLMELYEMIQVSMLLQPHGTVVPNFVPGNFGLSGGTPGNH